MIKMLFLCVTFLPIGIGLGVVIKRYAPTIRNFSAPMIGIGALKEKTIEVYENEEDADTAIGMVELHPDVWIIP